MDQYAICRHIKTNGEQCNSPRLLDSDHCFFHHRMLTRHRDVINGRRSQELMVPVYNQSRQIVGMEPATQPALELGLLEDRTSVQMAISTVLNALAAGHLEQRRATALLYGLQLASNNCPAIHFDHGYAEDPIQHCTHTPEGLTLAPADRVPASILERDAAIAFLTEPDDEDDDRLD